MGERGQHRNIPAWSIDHTTLTLTIIGGLYTCVIVLFVQFSEPAFSSEDFLFPYGEDVGDSQVPPSDDGSSLPIQLSIPIFGSTETTVFVSGWAQGYHTVHALAYTCKPTLCE